MGSQGVPAVRASNAATAGKTDPAAVAPTAELPSPQEEMPQEERLR